MAVINRHFKNKKMWLHKFLNRIVQTSVATVLLCSSVPRLNAQTELPPDTVAQMVFEGIQILHGSLATPQLYFPVVPASITSSCGPIYGSSYCPADHAVFITTDDIGMAYEHGDAALAYIIAHEYAHAMQAAFGFMPGITPISELQADCLAGLYLGTIPNVVFDSSDVIEIRSLAYRSGDYDTWGVNHHGTPQQRMEAVELGLDASQEGLMGSRACMAIGS